MYFRKSDQIQSKYFGYIGNQAADLDKIELTNFEQKVAALEQLRLQFFKCNRRV